MAKKIIKPTASQEDIDSMVKDYYSYYPGQTPDDIRITRQRIHEKMSKYQNVDDIYRAIKANKKWYSPTMYNTDKVDYEWQPDNSSIYPGSTPDYDDQGNVKGYSSIPKDKWIPEGYNPMIDDTRDFSEGQNFYAPDFVNTFAFYWDPNKPYPSTQSVDDWIATNRQYIDVYSNKHDWLLDDLSNITNLSQDQVRDVLGRYYDKAGNWNSALAAAKEDWDREADNDKHFKAVETLTSIYQKNKDWLSQQRNYAINHNKAFNYTDSRIVNLLDQIYKEHKIDPNTFYEFLVTRGDF